MIAGRFRGESGGTPANTLEEVQHLTARSSSSSTSGNTVIGAGLAAGAMDASNMLKLVGAAIALPAGATTLGRISPLHRKRPALERRFAPVYVEEPTVEDTIDILPVSAIATRPTTR